MYYNMSTSRGGAMTRYRKAVLLFALGAAFLSARAAYASEFNVVDKLTVTNNTGMGTTTPAAKLHLSSGTIWIDGDATNSLVTVGRLGIGVTSPSGALPSMLVVSGGAAVGSGYAGSAAPANGLIVQGNTGIGTTQPGALFNVTGVSSMSITSANAPLAVYQSGAGPSALFLGGNVGIGLTNPSAALEVSGSIKMSGGVSVYTVTNAYCKETPGTLTTAATCQTRYCTPNVTYRNNTYYKCDGSGCIVGVQTCANSALTGKMLSP